MRPQQVYEEPVKRKKGGCGKRCAVACLVCLIINVLFIAAVLGGSYFLFGKYVSPMIGGVSLTEVFRLVSGLRKADESKLLAGAYEEQDLNDFYTVLNSALYLHINTDAELETKYAEHLADYRSSHTEAEYNDYAATYTKEQYIKENKYPLNMAKIVPMLSGMLAKEPAEEQQAPIVAMAQDKQLLSAFIEETRANTGLNISLGAQADEGEPSIEPDPSIEIEEGESDSEPLPIPDELKTLIKDLSFDFDAFIQQYDASADPAETLSNITITDKQLGAMVGEALAQIIAMLNLNEMVPIEGIQLPDLSNFVRVPQVLIDYTGTAPTSPADSPAYATELDAYNKSVRLAATLQVKIRSLLESPEVDTYLNTTLGGMGINESIVRIAKKVVFGILPKQLLVTAHIYPLDTNEALLVSINNYTQQDAKNLSKVVNALTGTMGFTIGNAESGESDAPTEGTPAEKVPLLQQINRMVVSTFSSVQDMVPLTFVSGDSDNAKANLRIAHIQMLLSTAGVFDPANLEDSVTPLAFLTLLRCLVEEAKMDPVAEPDMSTLYAQLEAKYGIEQSYWDDHALLDVGGDLLGAVHLNDVAFEENEAMRVRIYEEQLSALLADMIESGVVGGLAAAEESDPSDTDTAGAPGILSQLEFGKITIRSTPGEGSILNTMDIAVFCNIGDLIRSFLTGEVAELAESLVRSIPQKLTLRMVLNIIDTDDGIVFERAMQGVDVAINTFSVERSDSVVETLSLLVNRLGGDGLDINQILSDLGDTFIDTLNKLQDTMGEPIRFGEQSITKTIPVEGGAPKTETVVVGCMVMPSVYEVVSGLNNKMVNESMTDESIAPEERLTAEDRIVPDDVRGMLTTLYNRGTAPYAPDTFVAGKDDEMLSTMQHNYYLKTQLTAEDLFGGDLGSVFGTDSLCFTTTEVERADGTTDTIIGLYADTRTPASLDVPLSADALAGLIDSSGRLNDLLGKEEVAAAGEGASSGLGDFVKDIRVWACAYSKEENGLALNLILKAIIREEGDPDDIEDGFSVASFLPDYLYIDACVLFTPALDADNNPVAERFTTDLIINDNLDSTNKILNVARVLGGVDLGMDGIKTQVKDTLDQVFGEIEDYVNITLAEEGEDIHMTIGNIFNTINHMSYRKEMDKFELGTILDEPIAPTTADDDALADGLREFGRNPAANVVADGDKDVIVGLAGIDPFDYDYESRSEADINAFFAGLSVDEDAFFANLNSNMYIADGQELTADNITDTKFDSSSIDFTKIYTDDRDISQLSTRLSEKAMGVMIDTFIGSEGNPGINVDGVGKATVVAVHITPTTLATIARVVPQKTLEGNSIGDIMPENLYVLTYTDIASVDEDVASPTYGKKLYNTILRLNNMNDDDTEDFFARVNRLMSALDMDTEFSIDTLVGPVRNGIKSALEGDLATFGDIQFCERYIQLPSIYELLVDGTFTKADGKGEGTPIPQGDGTYLDANGALVDADGYLLDGEGNRLQVKRPLFKKGTGEPTLQGDATYLDTKGRLVDEECFRLDTDGNRIKVSPSELKNNLRSVGSVNVNDEELLGADTPTIYNKADGVISSTLGKEVAVVRGIDESVLALANADDAFFQKTGDIVYDDANAFFYLLNKNYYTVGDADNGELSFSIDTMNNANGVSSSSIQFSKLYADTRPISALKTTLNGRMFGALATSIYPQINVAGGSARIVQMHVFTDKTTNADRMLTDAIGNPYITLQTIVQFRSTPEEGESSMLPEVMYITCLTIIDPLAQGTADAYRTEMIVNNMGNTKDALGADVMERDPDVQIGATDDFVGILSTLADLFGAGNTFELTSVKATLKSTFKELFETKLTAFGTVGYEDDCLVLPNIFDFLTEGAYAKCQKGTAPYIDNRDSVGRLVDDDGYLLDGLGERIKEDRVLYEKGFGTPALQPDSTYLDERGQRVDSECFLLDTDGNRIKTSSETLMYNLRAFGDVREGRTGISIESVTLPAGTATYYDAYGTAKADTLDTALSVIRGIDASVLALANSEDNFLYLDETENKVRDNALEFLYYLNKNFYTAGDADNGEMTINVNAVTDGIGIGSNFVDLTKIYVDTRSFSDIVTYLDGARFGALATKMYPDGLSSGTESQVSNARVVQMHIFTPDVSAPERMLTNAAGTVHYITLQSIVRVEVEKEGSLSSDIMPDCLYLTCLTIIDPSAPVEDKYRTEIIINNMGGTTVDVAQSQIDATTIFANRINTLASNYQSSNDLRFDSIKSSLKSTFGDLFDKLSIFGELKYENNMLILPNIYEYLANGQLVGGVYRTDSEYRMRDDSNSLLADAVFTKPEELMLRLREFGAGDSVSNLGNELYIWQDGQLVAAPTGSTPRYNDNQFVTADENKFYDQLQAYYFFKNKPSTSTLLGENSLFANLTTDFAGTFNTTGITPDSRISALGATAINHATQGLYNYSGTQMTVKLSDKALGSILNGRDELRANMAAAIKNMDVTSFSLQVVDSTDMTIEITMRVETNRGTVGDSTAGALPTCFYITARSHRTVSDGIVSYQTELALNRFASADFVVFQNNLNQLGEYGVGDQLDTASIKASIENALRDVLDGTLGEYIAGYGSFVDPVEGRGYMEFHSIYHEIASRIKNSENKPLLEEFENGATLIQEVLVGLHNAPAELSIKPNAANGTPYSTTGPVLSGGKLVSTIRYTDSALGYSVFNALRSGGENTFMTSLQCLLLDGNQSSALHNVWGTLCENSTDLFDFSSSILLAFTVAIDTEGMSASVPFLPDTLYATMALDISDATLPVKVNMINGLTREQQALLEFMMQGPTSNLEITAKISNILENDILTYSTNYAGVNVTLHGTIDPSGTETYAQVDDLYNEIPDVPYVGIITVEFEGTLS